MGTKQQRERNQTLRPRVRIITALIENHSKGFVTRRLCIALVAVLALTAGAAGCGSRHVKTGRRVIVLGVDGMDYDLVRDLIARGRLPHFAQLAQSGAFAPLRTTIPPQSPVAWSTFITGLDPGRTGIFDFIHRDPKTMVPFL